MFHVVNGFKRGDQPLLDLLAYRTVEVADAYRIVRMVVNLQTFGPR